MQTTETTVTISSTHRRNSKFRKIRGSHQPRCTKNVSKSNPPITCAGNAFLKTVFHPIPAYLAGCGIRFNADEVENLKGNTADYIIKSANNCLKKLGSELQLQSTSNLDNDCLIIQNALSDKLSAGQSVEFAFHKKRFSLCVTYTYWDSFPQYELFYLPIGGIEKMCSETAVLFKQFISYYAKSQNISYAKDYSFFECQSDFFMSYYYDDDQTCEELCEACKPYEGGIAEKTFNELKKMTVSSKKLKAAIQAYRNKSDDDELMDIMLQGIELFETDCISDYSHPVEDGVSFLELFTIIWKEDTLVQQAEHNINSSINESPEFPMPDYRQFVTPESNETLKKSQYPIEFANWWHKFYTLLSRYE